MMVNRCLSIHAGNAEIETIVLPMDYGYIANHIYIMSHTAGILREK